MRDIQQHSNLHEVLDMDQMRLPDGMETPDYITPDQNETPGKITRWNGNTRLYYT